MGLADDRVMQHHIAYFAGQMWVWIACVLVWGADLHTSDDGNGGTVSYYYDRVRPSGGGGSVFYRDCDADNSICTECKKGGDGAVALSVFCWLSTTALIVLRGLYLAQRMDVVPWLGYSTVRYARAEKYGNVWSAVNLFFVMIAWGVGCIREASKTVTVKPTAYVFIVMGVLVAGLTTALLWIIHVETDFGRDDGSAAGSGANGVNAKAGAKADAMPPAARSTNGASAGTGVVASDPASKAPGDSNGNGYGHGNGNINGPNPYASASGNVGGGVYPSLESASGTQAQLHTDAADQV